MGTAHAKSRTRSALEPPIFSPIRRWLMWREALAEHKFVNRLASSYGVPAFDYCRMEDGLQQKGKNVFYVLGSGSSVENLASEHFDAISRAVSVGINAWALHDFVPDIYSFEPVPERESDHYYTMNLLGRADVLARQPIVMFLKPRTPVEVEQLRRVPAGLIGNTMLYGRFQPYTRESGNLTGDLQMINKVVAQNLSVVPDSGASIVRMAFLGLLLGYRKVVFVGVDLNHTEYFWERNPKHLEKFGLEDFTSGQRQITHETLNVGARAFGVIEMVAALAHIARGLDSSLEVVSPHSMLADIIPLHSWDHVSGPLNTGDP